MLRLMGFSRSRKAKLAISWFFFVEGATTGNWASLLPTVKDDQDLSNSALGLILVAAVAGAVASLPLVSCVIARFGSGISLTLGGLVLPLLFPLIAIKHNLPVFCVGVMLLGFLLGWCDICMNNQAVVCEKMIRRPTLGLFHAVYAIGGLCGALIGGALLEQGVSPFQEVIFFSILMVVPEICLSCWLFAIQEEKLISHTALLSGQDRISSLDHHSLYSDHKSRPSETPPLDITPELASILDPCEPNSSSQTDWQDFCDDTSTPPAPVMDTAVLVCLCGLCFLAYLGEGSIGDWSAIYLDETLNTSPLVSTFGFVGFQVCVAAARLSSDRLVMRYGRQLLLQLAGVTAALGLGISASAAWVHTTYGRSIALCVSIAGFSLSGAGIGIVAPSVISLAGDVRGMETADAIGLVSSLGYVGVMVGPPLLGGLSALCGGLEWSFVVDACLMLCISLLAVYFQHLNVNIVRDVHLHGTYRALLNDTPGDDHQVIQ